MKFCLIFLLSLPFSLLSQEKAPTNYKQDFIYMWSTIGDYYSYFDKKKTDWHKVKDIYSAEIDTVTSRSGFISVLERVLYELYDHHASLNTNTMASQRLVPSGTDLWAEFENGKAYITGVRPNTAAASNLHSGMQVIEFNGVPIDSAITQFFPRSLKENDIEAKNFCLRILLAGAHNGKRKIKVSFNNKTQVIDLAAPYPVQPAPPAVEGRILEGNTGYILFNDRLWDNNTIAAFDSVLIQLQHTNALILDMRNTASGGNTTVARAIIGSFIDQPGPYQKHEYTFEEKKFGIKRSWVETVSPRKFIYKKPLAILVDRWTGSVGEGITIGFDALKRAKIIGTRMAALNGANYSFTMPSSGISFSFPAEKLFHVNGTPREDFMPDGIVPPIYLKGNDLFITFALMHLRSLK